MYLPIDLPHNDHKDGSKTNAPSARSTGAFPLGLVSYPLAVIGSHFTGIILAQGKARLAPSCPTLQAKRNFGQKNPAFGGMKPARSGALAKFLDYAKSRERVWIARRIDIAHHWRARHAAAR